MTHCPYGNIVSFSLTSRIHFCFKNTLKNAIQTDGKTPKTSPSLGAPRPHLIHSSHDRPHSPAQTAFKYNQPFFHMTDRRRDRQTD